MKNCNYDDGEHEFVGMDMCIYCGECKQLLLQPEFFRGADVGRCFDDLIF